MPAPTAPSIIAPSVGATVSGTIAVTCSESTFPVVTAAPTAAFTFESTEYAGAAAPAAGLTFTSE